jgi:hypothetical protein
MRNSLIAASVLSVVLAAGSYATEVAMDIDTELKAVSEFVWRGRILNDEPCFQPSITIGSSGFSASIWGSWNLTSVSNTWQNSRVDASFDYTFVLGKNIIRPGFVAYIYKDDPGHLAKDTYECFASYTYDVLLLPTLVVYYDFSRIDGFFATFSVAHSFELMKDRMAFDVKLTLDGADKAFNNNLFYFPAMDDDELSSPDKTSLVDLGVAVSAPITVGKNFTITPAAKFITLLDSDTKDLVDRAGQDTSLFVYSLAINYIF